MKRIFLIATAIIALASSSQAQITTDPNGNVGVGITTPAAQLHVFGPGQSTPDLLPTGNSGGTLFLQDSNGAPGNGGAVLFGSIFGPFAGIKALVQDGRTYTIGDLSFSTRASMANSSLTERMRISYTGNVGIGIPNPQQKLDIDGNIRINQTSVLYFDSSNGSHIAQSGMGAFDIVASGAAGNGNLTISPASNGSLYLNYASGNGVYFGNGAGGTTGIINNSGSIGIGTTDTHGYKLAVNGDIHTKKVVVDLINWPDYVFKPTYNLKPLSEVKSYIDLNHHLPEMPSEKEVAEKGVDLGEMNKLLTKKVEELTLYMIELQKRIDRLEKK